MVSILITESICDRVIPFITAALFVISIPAIKQQEIPFETAPTETIPELIESNSEE